MSYIAICIFKALAYYTIWYRAPRMLQRHAEQIAMMRLGILESELEIRADDDTMIAEYKYYLVAKIGAAADVVQRNGITRAEFNVLGSDEYAYFISDAALDLTPVTRKSRAPSPDVWQKVRSSQYMTEEQAKQRFERLENKLYQAEENQQQWRARIDAELQAKREAREQRLAMVRSVYEQQRIYRAQQRKILIMSAQREPAPRTVLSPMRVHYSVRYMEDELYLQSLQMKYAYESRYAQALFKREQKELALRYRGAEEDMRIQQAKYRKEDEMRAYSLRKQQALRHSEEMYDIGRRRLAEVEYESRQKRALELKKVEERLSMVREAQEHSAKAYKARTIQDFATQEQRRNELASAQSLTRSERQREANFQIQRALLNKRIIERQNAYYQQIQYMKLQERMSSAVARKSAGSPATARKPQNPQKPPNPQNPQMSDLQQLKLKQMTRDFELREAELQRLIFYSALEERVTYIALLRDERREFQQMMRRATESHATKK